MSAEHPTTEAPAGDGEACAMVLDSEIRALLQAAKLRLEHGTPDDRYRVASAFHAVLSADAATETLEWAVDYLRTDPAAHRPLPRTRPVPGLDPEPSGPVPLPGCADGRSEQHERGGGLAGRERKGDAHER